MQLLFGASYLVYYVRNHMLSVMNGAVFEAVSSVHDQFIDKCLHKDSPEWVQ